MSDIATEREPNPNEEPMLQLVEPASENMAEMAVAEVIEIVPIDEDLLPSYRRPRPSFSNVGYSEDSVTQYLNEISVHPLIEREDEIRLAKQIEAGREAQVKLKEWDSNPEKQVERLERLQAQRVIRYGEQAKRELIQANLRLVVSIARKYTASSGMPLLDLIQEGNLGLMHTVDKFDWHKGFKFSTYATFWIKQTIQVAIADSSRLVRIPRNVSDNMAQLRRVEKYFQSINQTPDDEALMEWLGWKPEMLERVRESFRHDQTPSLNAEVGDDGSSELGDFIGDPRAEEGYRESQRKTDIGASLIAAIRELKPKERAILVARYGLLDGQNKTLDEVGKEYGVTRERIRQIESKAWRALRQNPLLASAADYVEEDDF